MTLVGPSGIGKTRLALEIARVLEGSFVNGVFFVELASLTDPGLVLPTLGRAVGAREHADRSWPEVLAETMAPLQALLVLDNFEHLLVAAPAIAELVRHAPELKMLVTSTTVLQVAAEAVVAVPPLGRDEARALFVQQAAAAGVPPATIDASDAAIDAVCARLEGSPLAIELAAPWLRTLATDRPACAARRPVGARGRDPRRGCAASFAARGDRLELRAALAREREVFIGAGARSPAASTSRHSRRSSGPRPWPRWRRSSTRASSRRRMGATGCSSRCASTRREGRRRPCRGGVATRRTSPTSRRRPSRTCQARNRCSWLARLDQEHDNFRAALDRLGELDEPSASCGWPRRSGASGTCAGTSPRAWNASGARSSTTEASSIR